MLPKLSGILEMILRIAVISTLMSRIGFRATAYAEISAWVGAFLVNAYAFHRSLTPLLAGDKKGPGRNSILVHRNGGTKAHGTL